MKSIVLFVALVAGCVAGPLTYEKKEKLFSFHQDCLTKTGVDEKVIKQAKLGTWVEDPKFKEYAFCALQKFGFQNEAGEFQKEAIRNKLSEFSKNATIVETVMEKCLVQKESPVESAYYFSMCKHDLIRDEEPLFYVIKVSEKQKVKFDSFQKDCETETGVNSTLIADAQKEIFSEDPLFKMYAYCYSKKLGFQDKNGKIDEDGFRGKLKELVENYSEIDKLVSTCVAEKDTPENTAMEFFKCFLENSYSHFLTSSSGTNA